MKQGKNIILKGAGVLLTILMLFSCEEVINIDLDSVDPELVVEAVIAKDSTCRVLLTLTSPYYDARTPVKVDDAVVSISSNRGEYELLENQGGGLYRSKLIAGATGVSYMLNIEWGSKSITGSATLNEAVQIISADPVNNPFNRPGSEQAFILETKFADNPETDDFYMLRYTRNDTLLGGHISLVSDALSIPGLIDYTEWRYDFRKDDRVTVEVYSIDRNLFSYFMELNEITSSGIAFSTPYNPGSSLSEGALGYFAAWSFSSLTFVIN